MESTRQENPPIDNVNISIVLHWFGMVLTSFLNGMVMSTLAWWETGWSMSEVEETSAPLGSAMW